MPGLISCYRLGCYEEPIWSVYMRDNGKESFLPACQKHADELSARSETGPRARVVVTRERIALTQSEAAAT